MDVSSSTNVETVVDIETCSAGELWDREDFVRLSGYLVDGVAVTTTRHDELVDVINSSDVLIGHNMLGFDLLALARWHSLDYAKVAAKTVDTMIIARQLDPPSAKGMPRGYYGLDALAKRLGVPGKSDNLPALARKHGGYDKIPLDSKEYNDYLIGDLSSQGQVYAELKGVFSSDPYIAREHRVMARIGEMRLEGFKVDSSLLQDRLDEQATRKDANFAKLAKLYDVPMEKVEFKKNRKTGEIEERRTPYKSPLATAGGKAALIEAFKKLGVDRYRKTEKSRDISTAREDMEALLEFYSDPDRLRNARIDPDSVDRQGVADLVETVISVTTERTVYNTILNHLTDEERVYPSVTPEQASGRWSVTEPGLTVLGKNGGKWREREVFLPDWPDHVLITVDLDQVDARGVAGHAQDPNYMKLFAPGKDLHSEVAMAVFGRCDPPWRDRAKAISHGWSYGMSINGIVATTGVARDVAEQFDDSMKDRFPLVIEWQNGVRDTASAGNLLDNGFGRKLRPDPERAWTQAPGLVGQATTRDLVAEGILRLPEEIVPMIKVMIHDEVVASVPAADWKDYADAILKAFTTEFKGVPITAGLSGPAKNWGQVYGGK